MKPWDWLSLIEKSKNIANNAGVADRGVGSSPLTEGHVINAEGFLSTGAVIRLMTDLEIRNLAQSQKPPYFAKLKKKAYDKQLCSKEGYFWAMMERLSQEFAKKKPVEFELQLWAKFVKCAQREWEIEKLQSSLNAKCPVCGSKNLEFAEKGQQKGFVCLNCLQTRGSVDFIVNVVIENDLPEWKNRVTLGTGQLVPNSLCTRCGAAFRWYYSDEWEGWLCSGCGEEALVES